MSDEREIEAMLKELPLRAPTQNLDQRVLGSMTGRRSRERRFALAACIGVVCFGLGYWLNDLLESKQPAVPQELALDQSGRAPVRDSVPFDPQRIDLVWRQLVPGASFTVDHGPPIRALRDQVVDRTLWVDPSRNITVEVNQPSERIIFVRETPY